MKTVDHLMNSGDWFRFLHLTLRVCTTTLVHSAEISENDWRMGIGEEGNVIRQAEKKSKSYRSTNVPVAAILLRHALTDNL